MDAVRNQVEELVQVELDSANEKFPLFHSMHEAYAVMKEELEECEEEISNSKKFLELIWSMIRIDGVTSCDIASLKEKAIKLAVESIQLAAMAQKTIDSMDESWKE